MTTGDESGLLEMIVSFSQTMNDTMQLLQRQLVRVYERLVALEEAAGSPGAGEDV